MRKVGIAAIVLGLIGVAQPASAAMSIVRNVGVKRGPSAIAFDPVSQLTFVGSVTDDSIAVLSGAAQVAEITSPNLNPVGLAVDAAGARLIATSFNASKINVYSLPDRRKIGSVTTAGRPWGVTVNPSTGQAYIASFTDNKLIVLGRDNVTVSVDLPGCVGPIGIAYSSPSNRVLVACTYSGTVAVVDAATLSFLSSIPLGLGTYPYGVAADPLKPVAFVTLTGSADYNPLTGSIAVVDTAAARVSALAFTGGAPMGIAVSNGGTPYATLGATHKLAVLEAASGAILETVALPLDASTPATANNPQVVAAHPSGRYVVVGNFHAESISLVAVAPYL